MVKLMTKTTFLLHGGSSGSLSHSNVSFWRELVSRSKQFVKPTICVIPYASYNFIKNQDKVLDTKTLARRIGTIIEFHNPLLRPLVTVVSSLDILYFEKQLISADSIFIPGGDGDLLLDQLSLVTDKNSLSKLIRGKICAGESAGANVWSTLYYSNDNQTVNAGMGILPVATFCHYESEKHEELNKLFAAANNHNLSIIPINEGEYVHVHQ